MTVLYFSDLPHELVAEFKAHPRLVPGFKLIELAKDQGDCEYMNERWVIEDSAIAEESYMAGKLVNPIFQRMLKGNLLLYRRDVQPQ